MSESPEARKRIEQVLATGIRLCRAETDDGRRCIFLLSTPEGHPGYEHMYESHPPATGEPE